MKFMLVETLVIIRCIEIFRSDEGSKSGISLCFTSAGAGFGRAASAAVNPGLICGTSMGIGFGLSRHGLGVDGSRAF